MCSDVFDRFNHLTTHWCAIRFERKSLYRDVQSYHQEIRLQGSEAYASNLHTYLEDIMKANKRNDDI